MTKKLAGAFLLYLALAVLLTWPLARNAQSHAINAGDPLFYAWNLMHNFYSITRGFENLLSANIFYPNTNTLALSDTLAVQTVIAYPVIWLTRNPLLAVNLYTLLTFPVAGLGMYILIYSLVNNAWSGLIGGAMFAFSMTRFGQLSHIPALSSQWLPYFFYGLYWFLRNGKLRHAVAAGISFILLLGSSVYLGVFAVIIGIIMMGIFSASWVKNKCFSSVIRGRMKIALIPVIMTSALSVILMYPYILLKAEHPEITRFLGESSARAAYQKDYYSVTKTSVISRILPSNEGERALYPTVALLFLAGLGTGLWKNKLYRLPILLSGCVAITGLVLSFGPQRPFSIGSLDTGYVTLPYAYLYYLFPLLQILRVPARFSIIFILGLCILSGYGVARITAQKKWILMILGIMLLFFIEIWQYPITLISIPSYNKPPLVYQWIKQQENIRALIELPIGSIEEGFLPIDQQVSLSYERLTADTPLALETYRTYFAAYHDKKTVNGYSGYVTNSFHSAVNAMKSFPDSSSIRYLRDEGVTHIIVHLWQLPKEKRNQYMITQQNRDLKTAFQTIDGDIVYEIIP